MIDLIEDRIQQTVTITRRKVSLPGHVKIGSDTLLDPTWTPSDNHDPSGVFRSLLMPVVHLIDPQELWATAIKSPKGHFLTFVMPTEAFKNDWKFVKHSDESEPVSNALNQKLKQMTKDYKIRKIHTRAIQISRSLGQSLVFKIQNKQRRNRRRRPPIKLRVHPILPEEIYYDDPNDDYPSHYRINVRWGRQYRFITIPSEEAVLYVHKPDPFGNNYQGIPETYPIYDQLKWIQGIEHGYGQAMSQRGISMLHVKDPDYDLTRNQEYRDAYGNPAESSVMFSDKEVEINNIGGNTAGFNLLETGEAFSREASSASGVATSRLDGTQRGQVTGSQTDQDNYYSILNAIQENNDEYCVELYEMIDPTVVGKFEISYNTEPKLDNMAKAQILSIQAGNANELLDFFTYNQLLTKLFDLEPVEGGDITARIYIRERIDDEEDLNDKEGMIPSDTPDNSSSEDVEQSAQDVDSTGDAKVDGDDKLLMASLLAKQGFSYGKINALLKDTFGEGVSNSTLSLIKK